MYFFTFLSQPKPGNDSYSQYGGAYVNCWINSEKQEEAEEIARQCIDGFGWTVEAKEEDHVIYEEDYADSEEGLECYRKAEREGSCFVFHTYPLGPHEDD